MESVDLQHLCLGCMAYMDNPDKPCTVCGWEPKIKNQTHQLALGSPLHGNYMVGRVLGQGGFGITYIAWDINQGQKVAIKEYYPNGLVFREQDHYTVTPYSSQEVVSFFDQGRARFFSESENLSKFESDPNIISVKDFFEENGTAYIVMEFVEGQTLEHYLSTLSRPMFLADILAMLAPVVDSLEQVHKAGLIHRDISPDNIMISDEGEVKLLDFGAARVSSPQGQRKLTVTVKMNYAPPEQFDTHGEQGAWTDVYALAATIYNAITGRIPTSSMTRWKEHETLQRPTALGIAITPTQEKIILKGMAIDHKERYKSVREFFNDLKSTISNKKKTMSFFDKIKAKFKLYMPINFCGLGLTYLIAHIFN